MRRQRRKIRIGDRVEYQVTGTRGVVVKLKRIKGKYWALIDPIKMWIDTSKLVLIEEAKGELQARETQAGPKDT
ncbi:MAG: DUF2098 family protein [archaeon GB-1867-005]|nr:DUF2098 family protein [Candidatus Culexmicrobium cathedralense]